ncbi:hypothetical protein ACFUAC_19500 [Streptomyces sp. NPDC057148]|uniref:hypothetical protein n=1 Tax=Streptomyces sp. NPDC057148 TaxID=3346035 RepID=UPI00362C0863
MSRRLARKMLRQMAAGGPVEVAPFMATTKKLTRLAYVAQQFGYAYADIRQGGGPQGNGYVMLIVPDPSPRARARAARNWELYPEAIDGGTLPPLVPEAVELLKARITFDITAMYGNKQLLLLSGVAALPLAVPIGFVLGSGATAVGIACAAWAALMALTPIGFAVNRRYTGKSAALLEEAGFALVTDENGRLRYVPPEGQLPGHGNPFAAGT